MIGAPTMVIGGFTMHRISGEGMNPTEDTKAKLSSLKLKPGFKVLDTW
jgi:predicted methyltransferase